MHATTTTTISSCQEGDARAPEHLSPADQDTEARCEGNQAFFDPPLWLQRRTLVADILAYSFAKDWNELKLLDMGCGEGALLEILANSTQFETLLGVDIDQDALEEAASRLGPTPMDRDPMFLRERKLRVELYNGSGCAHDPRFRAVDAVTMVEVVEHVYPADLMKLANVVFGCIQPRVVIVTTPNADFNVVFGYSGVGKFRHWDHKFEWSRQEFREWVNDICETYGYKADVTGVGETAESKKLGVGFCTQVAVFRHPKADAYDSCFQDWLHREEVLRWKVCWNDGASQPVKDDSISSVARGYPSSLVSWKTMIDSPIPPGVKVASYCQVFHTDFPYSQSPRHLDSEPSRRAFLQSKVKRAFSLDERGVDVAYEEALKDEEQADADVWARGWEFPESPPREEKKEKEWRPVRKWITVGELWEWLSLRQMFCSLDRLVGALSGWDDFWVER